MQEQIKNSAFFPVKSPEYQAFKKTGFLFQNIKKQGDTITGKLICLCGKTEIFNVKLKKPIKEHGKELFDLTIKQFLMDDEHLLDDGYTPKQIAEIRQKYNNNLVGTIG